jgi:isoquinoline 1-oxidoreductase subunit beta
MASVGKIARRTFLIGTAAIAGGLAVGAYAYRRPPDNPLAARADDGEAVFNPYLTIAPDETITIFVPRAEMGQGVSTTLAALVAEELDVSLESVVVEHGPASEAYANIAMLEDGLPFPTYDESTIATIARSGVGIAGKFLALHVTGGSSSTVDAFEKMRQAGATAREALKQAAATRWGVEPAELDTDAGSVRNPANGDTLSYGILAAEAAEAPVSRNITLRAPDNWKLLGKSQPRTDMRAKVTGAPIFGVDVALPDMLHATVRINPHFGGGVLALDTEAARQMRGVHSIIEIDHRLGRGFAVIADNTWRAFMAADAVAVEWEKPNSTLDDAAVSELLAAAVGTGSRDVMRDDGDTDIVFADHARDRIVEAEYHVPYLAHAAMEPMNATARFADGKLNLWLPNQAPNLIQAVAAAALGIPTADCTVNTTSLGGGFGRRAEPDVAVYAALIARETGGRPVKLIWTREEDIAHDYYRPAATGRLRAALGADGLPEALDVVVAAPPIFSPMASRFYPSISLPGPDKSIVDGAFNQPYAIANYRVAGVKTDIPVPVGIWRSVGNSINGFFHECFMDELAAASGIDPLEYRLQLMAPYPVATALLDKVAEMSNWRSEPAEGRARGLAFTLSFGTWVAEVVEIARDDRGIRVENVWCAADPGIVLDPGIFEAQMMSGIVFGLSAALGQEITLSEGRVQQSNFHDFDALRIDRCPAIYVEILQNAPRMGGAGEPSTPPVAAALGNAIFALTGERLRSMPFTHDVTFV